MEADTHETGRASISVVCQLRDRKHLDKLLKEVRSIAGVLPGAILDVSHAWRYYGEVIVSFKSAETEALANGRRVKRFESIESAARRKLRQLNDQFRVCFRWTVGGAEDVEIVDYH